MGACVNILAHDALLARAVEENIGMGSYATDRVIKVVMPLLELVGVCVDLGVYGYNLAHQSLLARAVEGYL